jgi:hypothetical protein
VNVLPGYGGDPRVVANLLDGVNNTCDDLHVWLAPFTPGVLESIPFPTLSVFLLLVSIHCGLRTVLGFGRQSQHDFHHAG